MTFVQKLFSFQGRLRRRDYWLLSLLLGLGMVIVMVPLILAAGLDPQDKRLSLVSFLIVWPSLALMVKRIHDRNKPGWLAAVYWGPAALSNLIEAFGPEGLNPLRIAVQGVTLIVGLWFLVEFGFMDGTQGPNRYGKSPKGIGGDTQDRLDEVFA